MRKIFEQLGLLPARRVVAEQSPSAAPFPPIAPEEELAVIGDVHGMADLFERMLDRISREAPQARVICVGDLIDRGEESARALRLAYARRDQVTVLLGNHEEMLLRFLDEPEAEAERWLHNGGLQTLASFGLAAGAESRTVLRDRLREALGADVETWLRGLPLSWISGNVLVTHAGADPWRPITLQSARGFVWGHEDCGRRARTDGIWVVHGHRLVPNARATEGVVSIDTGAFAGGALTAALIWGGNVRFLGEPS